MLISLEIMLLGLTLIILIVSFNLEDAMGHIFSIYLIIEFCDLLDPRWKGKIVKAHPGYSGTIMTATYQMQRDLGWAFFEQLAKQNIMQVQSSADPPKKLDLGERAVMADGNEYKHFPDEGGGAPGRAGLCQRRIAADHRPEWNLQDLAQSERGKTVFSHSASAATPSSSSSMSAACARRIRKPWRSRGASPSRTSRP